LEPVVGKVLYIIPLDQEEVDAQQFRLQYSVRCPAAIAQKNAVPPTVQHQFLFLLKTVEVK
jgi:hypothetical protein